MSHMHTITDEFSNNSDFGSGKWYPNSGANYDKVVDFRLWKYSTSGQGMVLRERDYIISFTVHIGVKLFFS